MAQISIISGPGLFKVQVALLFDLGLEPRKANRRSPIPVEFFVRSASLNRNRYDPFRGGTTLKVYIDTLGRHPELANELRIRGRIVSITQPPRILNFTPPEPTFTSIYLMDAGSNKGWIKIDDLLDGACAECWETAQFLCNNCRKPLCADDVINHGASAADAPHQVQPIQPV